MIRDVTKNILVLGDISWKSGTFGYFLPKNKKKNNNKKGKTKNKFLTYWIKLSIFVFLGGWL